MKNTSIDLARLKELAPQIRKLEKEQKKIILEVMKRSRKNICEWASLLPQDEFKKAFKNLFVESHNKRHGTDYFTWGNDKDIQGDFERYAKNMFEGDCENENKLHADVVKYHEIAEGDDRFYYDGSLKRFFNLKTFKYTTWSRSSHETSSYSTDNKGRVVYTYSGTSYHGFGSVEDSVQQELVIDPKTFVVVDYTDSTDKYNPRSEGIRSISTDFLDGWIEFAKQCVIMQ